jgi:hypothetical protein
VQRCTVVISICYAVVLRVIPRTNITSGSQLSFAASLAILIDAQAKRVWFNWRYRILNGHVIDVGSLGFDSFKTLS